MKRQVTIFGVGFAAAVLAAAPLSAGTRVLSLGLGRGYDHGTLFQQVMTGTTMRSVRDALVADGFTFTVGESFQAADLTGFDILFLGLFDPAESLTEQEKTAIDGFVRAGGALVYVGDNHFFNTPNASVGGIFGVAFQPDATATMADVVADSVHPIIQGPAGTVGVYDGSLNLPGFFGGITDLGPYARPVLATKSRTVVAVIERDALQGGSGPVVFLSEANGLQDPTIGTSNLGDNLTLIRNIFAFVAGPQVRCILDGDCSDGLFCNGAETCAGGTCRSGSFPCTNGMGCKEDTDTCNPCATDAECNDGRFCNGVETCDNGLCEPGARPCEPHEGCHEEADACGPCRDDADCDDDRFCTGVERCDAEGVCHAEDIPCTGECERCDEAADSCKPCLLDLDADGFIGTGDFGFFAGCFGACYPPNDPCLAANFDGSPDGCVGTGDFGAFSGCFGAACGECGNCEGPDGGEALTVSSGSPETTLRIVAAGTPTKMDGAYKLPPSTDSFQIGETIYAEVWVSRNGLEKGGLAAVYTDVRYDPMLLGVLQIIPSETFELFVSSEVDAGGGRVRSLGGCTLPGETSVGIDPPWVRVGTVVFRAIRDGAADLSLASAGETFGISLVGKFGNLSPASVSFGRTELRLGGASSLLGPGAPLSNGSRVPR
jgi:hypothetical protein